jgi:hypothetical protein
LASESIAASGSSVTEVRTSSHPKVPTPGLPGKVPSENAEARALLAPFTAGFTESFEMPDLKEKILLMRWRFDGVIVARVGKENVGSWPMLSKKSFCVAKHKFSELYERRLYNCVGEAS